MKTLKKHRSIGYGYPAVTDAQAEGMLSTADGPRRRIVTPRNVFVGLVLILVLVLGVSAVRHPAPAVRFVRVHPRDLYSTIPATGEIQRPRIAKIPTLVSGNIGQMLVSAGAYVHAGQVLATIENPQLESGLREAQDSYLSAEARASSVAAANAALPAQHRSSVEQARVAIEQARAALLQAKRDQAAGVQSGLGDGAATADQQRLEAQVALDKAENELRNAERIYKANEELFAQKAISKDALEESRIHFEDAASADTQALTRSRMLDEHLTQAKAVLADRVRTAEYQVQQAEAALSAALADAAANKTGDVQAARADAAREQNAYLFAREQLDHTQVVAPFDGTIQRVASEPNRVLQPLVPGDAVQAGQELFTIATGSRFIVRSSIDEQDVAQVRVGDRATVSGEDFGGKTLGGRIVALSPIAERSLDPSNTARQVEATITLDGELPFLRDGMSANVDIVTKETRHVITVPNEAIHRDHDAAYVFVVLDGRAVKRAVAAGGVRDAQTVIAEGLRDGDIVVAEDNALVLPDVAVTLLATPNASTPAP